MMKKNENEIEKEGVWKRYRLLLSSIPLLLLFIVSMVLYNMRKESLPQRFYYFYNSDVIGKEEGIFPEIRRMNHIEEGDIYHRFVVDLFLGPHNFYLTPLFNTISRPHAVFEREGTLYVDMPYSTTKEVHALTYEQQLETFALLKKSIIFNFSEVQELVITVEGKEPLL